jgi:Holliday junction resolvasome RuvABC endonuclease subunit
MKVSEERIIEIPTEDDIERREETIEELFKRYLKENQTAVILIEEQLAMLLSVTARYNIKPEVVYMHLKISEQVIERSIMDYAPKEVRDDFVRGKKDVERIVQHAVKESLNLHEMLKTFTKSKGQYLEGYQ